MQLRKKLFIAFSTTFLLLNFFERLFDVHASSVGYDDGYGDYSDEEEEEDFEPDYEDCGENGWVKPKNTSGNDELTAYLHNLSYYIHRNGRPHVAAKKYGGTKKRFDMSTETREIIKQIIEKGSYSVGKKKVKAPTTKKCRDVFVFTPADFSNLGRKVGSQKPLTTPLNNCSFENLDSFSAAHRHYSEGRVLVMNFANAFKPGGGFLNGASAQEESLCIWSTLYASLINKVASVYYWYNWQCKGKKGDPNAFGTINMLLSPTVIVLRNPDGSLRTDPYVVSVISLAAPNLKGEARGADHKLINQIMISLIRNMVIAAAADRYDVLILGAFGCGAFGHDARRVAKYFRIVLHDEGYGRLFKKIVFAIPGSRKGSWMRKVFKSIIIDGTKRKQTQDYGAHKRGKKTSHYPRGRGRGGKH